MMNKTAKITLGVIGGSGLYDMPGLSQSTRHEIQTPFGSPSAPIVVGSIAGQRVAFLARHGLGHQFSPSEVNYRANIYALKSLGVERLVGINACGSLREDFAPGHIVIPDQLFDFTRQRCSTFFGEGMVAHIGSADPFCPHLSGLTAAAVRMAGATVHQGGTFITIEGPRFSTKAESHTFRSWGMSIVGMTCSPEAFLAREAGLCYAVMAHVTDFDVWHVSEDPVTVEMVLQVLRKNTTTARQAITHLVSSLDDERLCPCASALENAVITNPEIVPTETRQKLALLFPSHK